jgi:hypothetical protein
VSQRIASSPLLMCMKVLRAGPAALPPAINGVPAARAAGLGGMPPVQALIFTGNSSALGWP